MNLLFKLQQLRKGDHVTLCTPHSRTGDRIFFTAEVVQVSERAMEFRLWYDCGGQYLTIEFWMPIAWSLNVVSGVANAYWLPNVKALEITAKKRDNLIKMP